MILPQKHFCVLLYQFKQWGGDVNSAVFLVCSLHLHRCQSAQVRGKSTLKKNSRLSNRYKHYIMFINSAKSELVPQRGATKLWNDSCRTQHCIFWVCNKGVGGFQDRRLFWNTPFHFSPFLPPNSIWEFPAGGEKTLVAISPCLLHFFSCGFPPARFY